MLYIHTISYTHILVVSNYSRSMYEENGIKSATLTGNANSEGYHLYITSAHFWTFSTRPSTMSA